MWYSWWWIVWSFGVLGGSKKVRISKILFQFYPINPRVPQASKSLDLSKLFRVKSIIRLNPTLQTIKD
jgi:hypothetical protein